MLLRVNFWPLQLTKDNFLYLNTTKTEKDTPIQKNKQEKNPHAKLSLKNKKMESNHYIELCELVHPNKKSTFHLTYSVLLEWEISVIGCLKFK